MVELLMSFEMYKSSLERTGAVVLSVWGKLGFCFYYWSFKSSGFTFAVVMNTIISFVFIQGYSTSNM